MVISAKTVMKVGMIYTFTVFVAMIDSSIINDFKIDFEAKTAENDTLFVEEYDCPEEYSTKALFVDNSIIFKTICSYCEADSRPTDEEFASFVSRVDSGELSIETIKDNDNFQSEETGISEKQYDMVSKFLIKNQNKGMKDE